MKKILFYSIYLALIIALFNGCKKDNTDEDVISEETIATNKWINENMSTYYLWNNQMPANIDYTKESNPEAYFYKLLYTEKDKWSYITDDYASLNAELSGTPETMGYAPAFYLVGTKNVVIVVKYVYPGSAAADAGLKRGDIILSIDNIVLDTANYYKKYSGTSYSVQLGAVSGNTLVNTGISLSMTARITNTDPAIFHKVIDVSGRKIGYLVYVEFLSGTNDALLATLDNIFSEFRTEGISDLIVDLRYNPGGDIDAAVHLASEIAPVNVTTGKEILVSMNYNNDMQQYLESHDREDYLYFRFKTSSSNINMGKVYFLTTSGTASASELLISGLDPYMDVVQIGESTYGKYVGSWVMPDDNEKWAMMPIVLKFANKNGYSDFVNGLTPDFTVEDDLVSAVPFGDISDPQLAKALSLITGKSFAPKSLKTIGLENFRQIVPSEFNIKSNLVVREAKPIVFK